LEQSLPLGHSRPFPHNTEKLELPSISQVHTRGPVDIPWYNSHYSQRSLLSGDRLPNLHLPQSYTSSTSYGLNSSRSGLSDSSSNGNGSHYPSSQTSPSSYPSANSGIGLKTPSPSPTSQNIAPQPHGLAEEQAEHSEYSSQPQGIQPYTQVAEPYNITMNQPPQYMDSHQSHLSAGQSYAPQPTTAGGMSHYPQYQQQPPVLQTGPGGYAPPPNSYGQYSYTNGVTSPQGGSHPVSSSMGPQMNAMLPLPGTFLRFQQCSSNQANYDSNAPRRTTKRLWWCSWGYPGIFSAKLRYDRSGRASWDEASSYGDSVGRRRQYVFSG